MISDADLLKLTNQADEALQEIQNALGRDERTAGKVRFPRGFLQAAGKIRMHLRFVNRNVVRNNIAYTLMLHDVHLWLLRRTDLAGLARDMLVKACLTSLGSVAEALLIDHFTGRMGRRQKFTSRTKRLVDEGVICQQLKEDLDWLWGMRCRQHLYELMTAEFDFYRLEDHKRARATLSALVKALNNAYAPSSADAA